MQQPSTHPPLSLPRVSTETYATLSQYSSLYTYVNVYAFGGVSLRRIGTCRSTRNTHYSLFGAKSVPFQMSTLLE